MFKKTIFVVLLLCISTILLHAIANSVYATTSQEGQEITSVSKIQAHRSFDPPTNIQAIPGNNCVLLTWDAPSLAPDGGYKIFRNSNLITPTPIAGTSFTDITVTNGITYSYYLVSVYLDPSGESPPSETVTVTPFASAVVTIGTGTTSTSFPIDRSFKYSAWESIYLQSEIGIAGKLTKLSFYKAGGTNVSAITNVTIYCKHTTETTLASDNYSLDGYTLVYTGNFTNNATSGWMEVTLNNPFLYNNIDNLQVLVLKGNQTALASQYPTWRYTTTNPNYQIRFNRSNTDIPQLLNKSYLRANIRLNFVAPIDNPIYMNDSSSFDFGFVPVGQTSFRTFTISNNGGGVLAGEITAPDGYTIMLPPRNDNPNGRNTVAYNIPSGISATFKVIFTPLSSSVYSGNINITSNDPMHLVDVMAVTGIGKIPSPDGLIIQVLSSNRALSWTPVPFANTYYIYRTTDLDSSFTKLATVHTNSYVDTDNTAEKYFYYVTAE